MLTFRLEKGRELTWYELDDNFRYQYKWKPNSLYKLEMVVLHNYSLYECIIQHTAGSTFDGTKWKNISGTTSTSSNDSASIKYFWNDLVEQSNTTALEGELGVQLWEVGRPVYRYKQSNWTRFGDETLTNNYFDLDGPSESVKYVNNGYPAFQNVKDALDFLLYTPISISLSGGGLYELGTVIQNVNLTWTINGGNALQSQQISLSGSIIASPTVNLRAYSFTNQNINTNKTYTIVVNDGMGTKSNSTSLSFLPPVYYAAAVIPTNYDNQFLLSMTKTLKGSRTGTFNVNANSGGDYIWYAIPTSFGTPAFYVGGFEGGFQNITTFQHTNSQGYTQNYDVWRSTYPNLGDTTVNIQ